MKIKKKKKVVPKSICPECKKPRVKEGRVICVSCEKDMAHYKKIMKKATKIKEKLRPLAISSAKKARTYIKEMED